MSSVVISGDSSGTVSLTVPAVAGTNTATLPAATGTVMVSGNMPAFSAYPSAATTTISNQTFTKITNNTESFDTASCFNNTGSTVGGIPSYAFLPNVAGYYQVNVSVGFSAGVSGQCIALIYKNGAFVRLTQSSGTNSTNPTIQCTGLIYLNGTTDYIEAYCYIDTTAGTRNYSGGSSVATVFEACLARAA